MWLSVFFFFFSFHWLKILIIQTVVVVRTERVLVVLGSQRISHFFFLFKLNHEHSPGAPSILQSFLSVPILKSGQTKLFFSFFFLNRLIGFSYYTYTAYRYYRGENVIKTRHKHYYYYYYYVVDGYENRKKKKKKMKKRKNRLSSVLCDGSEIKTIIQRCFLVWYFIGKKKKKKETSSCKRGSVYPNNPNAESVKLKRKYFQRSPLAYIVLVLTANQYGRTYSRLDLLFLYFFFVVFFR